MLLFFVFLLTYNNFYKTQLDHLFCIEQALQEAIDRHREELELTVGVPE